MQHISNLLKMQTLWHYPAWCHQRSPIKCSHCLNLTSLVPCLLFAILCPSPFWTNLMELILIYSEMHKNYVHNSVSFEKCICPCNQASCQNLEHSITPWVSFVFPLHGWVLPVPGLQVSGTTQSVLLSAWCPRAPVYQLFDFDSCGEYIRHKYITICVSVLFRDIWVVSMFWL